MPRVPNLRSLPLKIAGVDSRVSAEAWLDEQPAEMRAVSGLTAEGRLFQKPSVHEEAFVDPTAQLIGGVIVSSDCYVGPFAVLRLDEAEAFAPLVIGRGSNIQDCAVVHSHTERIGEGVIVAHQAIIHGARIEDEVTIYIQAVADGGGTSIGRGSFLHQGSYVGKGIRVPENRLVAPGVKVLTQAEADALPPVPEELVSLRNNVLEHNRAHVARHLESLTLS